MNDFNLPDDPARWPTDPYAILGVGRQVDRRELRRAYVRLIRRFKPDHFPSQFRRIRDAYESIDGYLQYQERFGVESPFPDEDSAGNATAARPADGVEEESDETIASSDMFGQRVATVDGAAAAWRLATQGRITEAYRNLQNLTQRRTNDADLYARLYWLLVLHPNLDPERDRRQWLTTGLSATGFDNRLMELYDRELLGDPEEVLQPRCRGLLECRCQLEPWARFIARCWQIAGLSNRWEMINQDMQVLREEVAGTNRTVWSRLLLASAEQYLWQDDPRAYDGLAEACRSELEGYAEEHWTLSYDLDRCDYLVKLAADCRTLAINRLLLPEFSNALRNVLRHNWVVPFDMIRPQVLLLLRPMVEDPRRAMNDLDQLDDLSTAVLYELNSLVQTLHQQRQDRTGHVGDDEELTTQTETFLRTVGRGSYEQMRPTLLFHCISNHITLNEFQSAAETGLPLRVNGMEELRRDLPLRCLTTACQAFWS